MKTEKQVRTWWLDDTQERLNKGKTIVFEGHTTEPKEWEETDISFKVIAHEDHLEIVAEYEQKIKTLSFALNEIKYLDTTEKRFNFIAETFEQLDKESK